MDLALVVAAGNRGARADNPDASAPGAAQSLLHGRLHDAEDLHGRDVLEHIEAGGRDGVAGRDQVLDVPLEQEPDQLFGEALDDLEAARTVGDSGGIAEEHEALVRKGLEYLAHD